MLLRLLILYLLFQVVAIKLHIIIVELGALNLRIGKLKKRAIARLLFQLRIHILV